MIKNERKIITADDLEIVFVSKTPTIKKEAPRIFPQRKIAENTEPTSLPTNSDRQIELLDKKKSELYTQRAKLSNSLIQLPNDTARASVVANIKELTRQFNELRAHRKLLEQYGHIPQITEFKIKTKNLKEFTPIELFKEQRNLEAKISKRIKGLENADLNARLKLKYEAEILEYKSQIITIKNLLNEN